LQLKERVAAHSFSLISNFGKLDSSSYVAHLCWAGLKEEL
jgi:hypothetical protein